MDQLEESHPADQWIITGTAISDDESDDFTSTRLSPRLGTFEQYQMGYSSLGICTDFVKESCDILSTKHVLWNPSESSSSAVPEEQENHGNILSQCMHHHTASKHGSNATTPPLNIILIGDSLVRYNVS